MIGRTPTIGCALRSARIVLVLALFVLGCSPAPDSSSGTPVANRAVAGPNQSAAIVDGGSSGSTATGMIVLDIQQSFVTTATRRNGRSNVAGRVENAKQISRLADALSVPFFVTYEATNQGSGALPPSVKVDIPPSAKHFIKTTFAATGQPQFAQAVNQSGLRRFLIVGAETDVCVMQTILGLRRAGFGIAVMPDALFTEEVNIAPALRRLRQAGVAQLGMPEAEALLRGDATALDAVSRTPPPVIVRPLEIGIVLHRLDQLGANDANASAKRARLKELLTISEWFRLPLFAADPASATAALPADLRSIVTRPLLQLAQRPAGVTQVAIAGGHPGAREAIAELRGKGVDTFVVEDALMGGSHADLEPAYAEGAVPTSYKTLYYELTRSVDDREWPSQQWVKDGERYFDLTLAPEDLPQLLASP